MARAAIAPRGVAGRRPNQPIPARLCGFARRPVDTSANPTSVRQTRPSTTTVTSAISSWPRPAALPAAVLAGAAHAAPSGVQASTATTEPTAVSAFRPSSRFVSSTTSGASSDSPITRTAATASRDRRVESSSPAPVAPIRESSTQVSTMQGTQTSATRLASGDRDQVATVAKEISTSARPGTPSTPATVSPIASRVRSIPRRANRRGSRVSSMPTKIGTTRNASTASEPPPTTTEEDSAAGAKRRVTSSTTSISVMPAP